MEFSSFLHCQPPPPPIKNLSKREVFFRTLATNLKEANKHYSGKTTKWKNPFLYKNALCGNYCLRSYCRYGVNCWYAHGAHELRRIPESDEIPNPTFIAQYLSFLGLPKHVLDGIIANAYQSAQLYAGVMNYTPATKNDPELPSPESTVVISQGQTVNENSDQYSMSSSSDVTPPITKFYSLFD